MNRGWSAVGQFVLDLFGPPTPRKKTPSPAEASGSSPVAIESISWGARGGTECRDLDLVRIVFMRRLRRSWKLERPRSAHPVLHLPRRLEEAPEEVWAALGQWVRASLRPSPGSRSRAREAARKVFAWLGDEEPQRLPGGSARGRCHDLEPLFERLNREHFQGRVQALVRWSPRPGSLSTHRTVNTATGERHVITLGQIYDDPDVPVYAVEGVLFHEMLHAVHPPKKGSGARRHVHHAEFRRAEQAFPGYAAWREWEHREIPRLLRRLRRRVRS